MRVLLLEEQRLLAESLAAIAPPSPNEREV